MSNYVKDFKVVYWDQPGLFKPSTAIRFVQCLCCGKRTAASYWLENKACYERGCPYSVITKEEDEDVAELEDTAERVINNLRRQDATASLSQSGQFF
jgi:hypothetical protein